MNCYAENSLSVIQGDTLDVMVWIDNPEEIVIERVEFVCKTLNLREDLDPLAGLEERDAWGFAIDQSRTLNFRVGDYTFDVTAFLDSGERFTIIYQGILKVEPKYNL